MARGNVEANRTGIKHIKGRAPISELAGPRGVTAGPRAVVIDLMANVAISKEPVVCRGSV